MTCPPTESRADPAAWLARLEAGATAAEAFALFDALPAVPLEAMTGRWRGRGLPTGHRFDGMLEGLGWYGKEFFDSETVYPLLFRRGERLVALAPGRLPVDLLVRWPRLAGSAVLRGAFRFALPLFATPRPGARLRLVTFRGQAGAAMVYDRQPIIDVFRQVDADTLLGVMDLRGLPEPYFFVLRRDPAAGHHPSGDQPW
ncbi:hypothetical protein CCR97_28260 [Rhodoplanes elegans]|uniref:DUF4334 domain-containing protein n=1 Tax=Rhodoplanes elegans TaxID=29408 RepID=A0A327JSW2_9BRAD|nr:hypothetical protein [Rhodoplanes elegans]RAI28715.1 hypothetical protein CH338_29160 [Rhodoplanes elegans]